MQTKSSYSFRALTNQDRIGVMELVANTFKTDSEFWRWKYELNPDFDRSLVIVALNANQVVGCAHWLPRNLKVSGLTTIKAVLGADLAVCERHKGQGVGRTLISYEKKILENKKTLLSYGFIEPDLVKHIHSPQIGLVAVPTSTIVYKKYLNCKKVRDKTLLFNKIIESSQKMRKKLAESNERILFRLKGIPPFLLKLSPKKIELEEDDLTNPGLKVECDLAFLTSAIKGKRRILKLAKALLLGKMKIKPTNIRSTLKLYSTLKILEVLFSFK